MQTWNERYGRELIDTPPADQMIAAFMGYEPPAPDAASDAPPEEWVSPMLDDSDDWGDLPICDA